MPSMRSITITSLRAVVPVASRAPAAAASAAKLRRSCAAVGRLAHQVELVVQVLVELGDDLARLAAACRRPRAARPAPRAVCISARSCSIDLADAGPQHLDRDLACRRAASAKCTCAIDALATGSRSNAREHVVERPAVDARRASPATCVRRERRHAVLQLARARRRCRAAAGRAASTAPGRT